TFLRRMPEKKFGYDTPGWKGAPWAITSAKWVPRKCWVVEQMPKDPYYNWGLHVNYVDKETFSIWHKEVYDKAGQFQVWMIAPRSYCELPDGRNDIGEVDAYIITNEKVRHSTMSNIENPHELYLPANRLVPGDFTMSNFLKASK
ncbi:MAG: DUF1329 domain-containing protein, partial [Proteobacteria bacterium]|nr:DUF1329 domain-containing protein [Pseudomonadota bacterium]